MFRLISALTLRCARKNVVKLPVFNPVTLPVAALQPIKFQRFSSTDGHVIPQEIENLQVETYHKHSDAFLDGILENLEALSEDFPEKIPDIEYNHGVMTLETVDGSYVINKQPPNKQIWLSSPISGPSRFDFYQGDWVSLRDGSKLVDILNAEIRGALDDASVDIGEGIEYDL